MQRLPAVAEVVLADDLEPVDGRPAFEHFQVVLRPEPQPEAEEGPSSGAVGPRVPVRPERCAHVGKRTLRSRGMRVPNATSGLRLDADGAMRRGADRETRPIRSAHEPDAGRASAFLDGAAGLVARGLGDHDESLSLAGIVALGIRWLPSCKRFGPCRRCRPRTSRSPLARRPKWGPVRTSPPRLRQASGWRWS